MTNVHTQAGGNGDSANQQVDTPVDRNRDGGSLGRVHVRDDRSQTGGNEGVPRRGTQVRIVASGTTRLVFCVMSAWPIKEPGHSVVNVNNDKCESKTFPVGGRTSG